MQLQAISIVDLHACAQADADGLLPSFVAERAIQMLHAGVAEHWARPFYILRRFDQVVLGSCGFKHPPINGRIELGYGVFPIYQRQGFATAAVGELLHRAFSSAEVSEVLAQINPDNAASIKVVQKLGFELSECLTDEDSEPLQQWIAVCKHFRP
ncbi:GNAT family N-acetyltransferase [Iodobacter arcticus]|uniref:GNAT family N-acetyltransferase n=1 Tax=Iodobacter arcticus TaxID=590593 RepID=A0ABW2R2P0_9NEIS